MPTTITSVSAKSVSIKTVKHALEAFWDAQVSPPLSDSGSEVFSVGSEMDSLTAVAVLCELEVLLGIDNLPETLVKRGGYKTKQEFVELLSKSVVEHYLSH